jgi:hypothetical protein
MAACSPFEAGFEVGVTPTPYIVVGSASVEIFAAVLGHLYNGAPVRYRLLACTDCAHSRNKMFKIWRMPWAEAVEGASMDADLARRFVGHTVALQDGRQGTVQQVQPGGVLQIELCVPPSPLSLSLSLSLSLRARA